MACAARSGRPPGADGLAEQPPHQAFGGPESGLDKPAGWTLERDYFERQGVTIMGFSDFYPEGHQGGVTVIQDGLRLAANGDVRLEPAPGQWQPVPKLLKRQVEPSTMTISARLAFPDEEKNRKGFNPIAYPDLALTYDVRVTLDADDVLVTVDLDQPLPEAWVDRVGFNLELFPGEYFGTTFNIDGRPGLFPRQVNGALSPDMGSAAALTLGKGTTLDVAPEDPARHITVISQSQPLSLLDGRIEHNNGWFIVRVPLRAATTKNAAQLRIKTHGDPSWHYGPVLHVSQVGYHPTQKKQAVVELDRRSKAYLSATLVQVHANGKLEELQRLTPEDWGDFLRYHYLRFDFSSVTREGTYFIRYAAEHSNVFRISPHVFEQDVWQPTLEYFLPVQMCHMRVNDRYRVWHGHCHADDARMAPTHFNHIDGYTQGAATLTKYAPRQAVPGLNRGGWHDAGDYDLRVESQAGAVRLLSQMYEQFAVRLDSTTVDQDSAVVELHRPDGKPDILQQIEHGVLSIVGGYEALGRLYRGIISPTIRQYVMLGDAANMSDGQRYAPNRALPEDDRWVFTENNLARQLEVAASLAVATRALAVYNPTLSERCLNTARALVPADAAAQTSAEKAAFVQAWAELWLTTRDPVYQRQLEEHLPDVIATLDDRGWVLGRLRPILAAPQFWAAIDAAMPAVRDKIVQQASQTPFGVPYEPNIWGAGWAIQEFGVRQYFLAEGWPELFSREYLFAALNFVLGNHPGSNTASYASGVGARSLTVAYGANRADFSYIPGGVASGTALIRPDFPELKDWPFFWQQGEYVIGGGAENFMFMTLAANQWLLP